MTAGAPWSVKGIDPKAREIAKDLARRSGMTLGEWLNQMILDDGVEPPVAEAVRRMASTSPQALSASAFGSVRGERAAPRLEATPSRDDELERVIDGLDRLSARIEAAESRSTLAISGIDQSVLGVLARMEVAEREQVQVAARFEGAIDEVRTDQARAAERLRRIEQESTGHRSAEAMRALESALNKVAGHLYEGETRTREAIGVLRRDMDVLAQKTGVGEGGAANIVDAVVSRLAERLEKAESRTSDAMRSLENSFSSLDERMQSTEAALEQSPAGARLEALANELAQKVEQVRLDMAQQINASADGRVDRLERSLRDMAAHVQAAERSSAKAIEKMGSEVVRMADTLGQKVQASESRSAEAMDQVGAEVARVANAVEQKLRRVDGAQAEALEKLGTEIARITERLAERIASAERRSAHAIDDVGEQMARVTERFNQRQERASSELLDRMRQSEERTARLLEEARERIDRRLGDAPKSLAAPAPIVHAPAPAAPTPPAPYAQSYSAGEFADPFAAAPFPESPFPATTPAAFTPYDAAAAEHAASYADEAFPMAADEPAFGEEDFEASQSYGRLPPPFDGAAPPPAADAPAPESEFEAAPTRSASTRELIAAARAAARQASQPQQDKARESGERSGPLGRFGKKKKDGDAVSTALRASVLVAALGVSAAGYVLTHPDMVAGWSKSSSADKVAGAVTAQQAAPTATTPAAPPEPLAATLTTDLPPPSPDANSAAAGPAAPDSSDLYNQAKDKIKANDPAGMELLRKAANLGYAPAQFYLAKLYEDGSAGLKKDMVEARRWTQRAATNGDPKAMHNLGLYFFHGDGGAKNLAVAALWFRRAADLGLVDSQYNLAQLYEQGLGVGQNPAEAYKWFLIAGKAGDGESKASAERMKAQLTSSAQQAALRAAEAFRAESVSPSAAGAPASMAGAVPATDTAERANLALAQKALSKLGYYKGPTDGANSPALRLAIASYQKALGTSADGALNPQLLDKFTAITR